MLNPDEKHAGGGVSKEASPSIAHCETAANKRFVEQIEAVS